MHKIHVKMGPFIYREQSVKALNCFVTFIKHLINKNKLKIKNKNKRVGGGGNFEHSFRYKLITQHKLQGILLNKDSVRG